MINNNWDILEQAEQSKETKPLAYTTNSIKMLENFLKNPDFLVETFGLLLF